jgi:hypothetical protein
MLWMQKIFKNIGVDIVINVHTQWQIELHRLQKIQVFWYCVCLFNNFWKAYWVQMAVLHTTALGHDFTELVNVDI